MKKVFLLTLLALLVSACAPAVVQAQEATVIQYHLIPVDVYIHPDSGATYRGPMYLKWRWNPSGLDVQWSCKDYGVIDIMMCAVNAEPVDQAYLDAQTDTYTFPEVIDSVNPSPAELSALETYLEASYIPANWLSPSEDWRTAMRTITGMFLFMQRLTTITGSSPLDWGVTLNTRFNQLDQAYQDALIEAYDTLGYDSSVVRDNWTLRVILKNTAEQWGTKPILFGFTTL